MYCKISQIIPIPAKIIPPRDNMRMILDGCFNYGIIVGPEMADINTLEGGVELSDPQEVSRIDKLIKDISSPSGYFERILVEANGSVLEGQHRLEAARKLGWPQVPILRVADFSQIYNVMAMEQSAMNIGKLNHDRAFYLVREAIECIQKSGSPQKALADYEMSPDLQLAWEAVMQSAMTTKKTSSWYVRYKIASKKQVVPEEDLGIIREFNSIEVHVENQAGTDRVGVNDKGVEWRTKMKYDYGFVYGIKGSDGDALDVYLGPDQDARKVYVVHQSIPETGEYDEDKCMLGFSSPGKAKEVYLDHYDSEEFFGSMTEVSFADFKKIVENGDRQKINWKKRGKKIR